MTVARRIHGAAYWSRAGRILLVRMKRFSRRKLLTSAASTIVLSGLPRAAAQTPRPGINVVPIEFGTTKMVFCDWWFVEAGFGLAFTQAQQAANHYRPMFMPYGVRLRVARPTLTERPVIVPDQPADGITMGGYCTMLKDGGKYRLWYESYLPLAHEDEDARICYAESDDGFTWRKPKLGIYEYQGTKDNNLVYNHGHGATIFLDPSAKPDERYKMIHLDAVPLQMVNGKQMNAFVFGAVSADGIHWKRLPEPLIKHTSDTQSVAQYDSVTRKYVAYLRGWDPQSRAGYGGRRMVMRTESPEFGNFPEPAMVLSLGPEDPPDADIYTNAYRQWPGAGRAYLMIPAIYHRGTDNVDLRLAVSHDGTRWHFPEREPFLQVGEPGFGYEGTVYAGAGTVPIGKNTWAFPVSRYHRSHNMGFQPTEEHPRQGGIWLAMLREDGFITLEAETRGECWTQPATFTGSRLLVNCWGLTGSRVAVEITSADGEPMPGFALDDCDGLTGEQLWGPMTWKGSSDVSALREKLVRIRFVLNRVRLHAFQFA
jgi:hypothetical protein